MMKPISKTARILVSLVAVTGLAVVTASCTTSVAVGCGDDPNCPDTSGVAVGKMVQHLTAEDRDAWCNWFVASLPQWLSVDLSNYDNPTPRVWPDGTLNDAYFGCSTNNEVATPPPESFLCLPGITVEECKESLAVQPCTATLQALDDCARMLLEMEDEGHTGDYSKSCESEKSRCDAFLAAEGCDGTVLGRGHVDPNGGPEAVCPIRVR